MPVTKSDVKEHLYRKSPSAFAPSAGPAHGKTDRVSHAKLLTYCGSLWRWTSSQSTPGPGSQGVRTCTHVKNIRCISGQIPSEKAVKTLTCPGQPVCAPLSAESQRWSRATPPAAAAGQREVKKQAKQGPRKACVPGATLRLPHCAGPSSQHASSCST
ncbi:hypothetical protein SRHO_G00046910 [Serrasalmus rhombeus]